MWPMATSIHISQYYSDHVKYLTLISPTATIVLSQCLHQIGTNSLSSASAPGHESSGKRTQIRYNQRVTFILLTVTLVSHVTPDSFSASIQLSVLSIKSVLNMFLNISPAIKSQFCFHTFVDF